MGKEIDQAKGKIKQAVGDLTGNKDLKKQGKANEQAGKALDNTPRNHPEEACRGVRLRP